MPNPIDVALDAKEEVFIKSAARARQREQDFYTSWKSDPTPQNMRPLMGAFKGLIRSKRISWKAPQVPDAAFDAKAQNLIVEGVKNYDPDRHPPTQLKTFLEWRLQPLKRYNIQQQNKARISEGKASRIGDVNGAVDDLTEELGRAPRDSEIAKHLNPFLSVRQQLSAKKVKDIRAEQRADVSASAFESDPSAKASSREHQVLGLLRPALPAAQQNVFDHIYGLNGKPKATSNKHLAKLIGKSESRTSHLRTAILTKYEEYA